MGGRGETGTVAGPQAGPEAETEPEAASHQRFGVQILVSLAVGGSIGSGWLFGAPGVWKSAGLGSLLSWALGGVFMVATGVVLVELGGRWRENGGLVFWPSQACGPLLTTMVAATLWFFYALNPASESVALLFGDKVRLTLTDQLAALLVMVPIIAVNLCSLRVVLRITLVLAVFKIVVPVVVVVALLVSHFHADALAQVPRESNGNWFGSALTAITGSGVIYAYIGFQGPLDFAGQVRTAGRGESWRLRWAVLGTVAGTSVVYVLLQLVYLGHRGWLGTGAGSPFIGLVDGVPVIGTGLRYSLDLAERLFPAGTGIVFALLLTREIEQLSMSRFTDARLIESRSLPSRFFKGREVLWRILSVNLVIGAISLFVLGARWERLSAASGTLALLIYAMPAVCLGTLARVDRTIARWLRLLCGFCFTATTVIIFWSDQDVLLRVAVIVGVGTALLLVLPSDLVRHRKLIGGYRAASHLRRIREHRSDPHVKAALVYAGYIGALVLLSGIGPSSPGHWIGDGLGIVIAAVVGVVSYGLLVRYSAEHLLRGRSIGSAAVAGSTGSTSSTAPTIPTSS